MPTFNTAASNGLMIDDAGAGEVKCRSAKFTAPAGGLAANDVIEMLKIPKGARVLKTDHLNSAFGAGRTIDIGVSGSVNKYVDGADVAAAGEGSKIQDMETTAEETVQVTVLGGTMPQDATLSVHVYYKMAGKIADEVLS